VTRFCKALWRGGGGDPTAAAPTGGGDTTNFSYKFTFRPFKAIFTDHGRARIRIFFFFAPADHLLRRFSLADHKNIKQNILSIWNVMRVKFCQHLTLFMTFKMKIT
jgi:hypothetical protein